MERLLLLTAIFLTACSNEPEVFSGPYLTRDGILYSQETNLAITGVALRHFESGELLSQTYYLNGLKYGVHKEFHKNGQLHRLENYQSGILHGSSEMFSESGYQKIAKKYAMSKLLDQKGDLMTGLVEYNDGHFIYKRRYKNGLEDGYGGVYEGSIQMMDWCYRDGVSLEKGNPYCGDSGDSGDRM